MGKQIEKCGNLGPHVPNLRRMLVRGDGEESGKYISWPYGMPVPDGYKAPDATEATNIFLSEALSGGNNFAATEYCTMSEGKGLSLFSYAFDSCNTLSNNFLQDMGIDLKPNEALALMGAGALGSSQVCRHDNLPTRYMFALDVDVIDRVMDGIMKMGNDELPHARRQVIVNALFALPSMEARRKKGSEEEVAKTDKAKARETNEKVVEGQQFMMRWMPRQIGTMILAVIAQIGISVWMVRRLTGGRKVKNPLQNYGRNINADAKAGILNPYVGGEKVFNDTVEVLGRRETPNPLLVGRPGVGKTAAVEGLAQHIETGRLNPAWIRAVPGLANAEIWEISLSAIEADNTEFRGGFEKNLDALLKQVKALRAGRSMPWPLNKIWPFSTRTVGGRNIWLFIDEAHLMVSAGSAKNTPGMGQKAKTFLARSGIPVIAATTDYEVEIIMRDPALGRRFEVVSVPEPNDAETVEILDGAKEAYAKHHGLEYSKGAIAEIAKSAPPCSDNDGKPLSNPARSIKVLDSLPTWVKMRHPGVKVITEEHVREWIKEKGGRGGAGTVLLHTAGLNVMDEFMPREADATSKVTISPELRAVAEKAGLPPERIPDILAGEANIASEAEIGKIVEERFTPEKLAAWLESKPGNVWIAENRPALMDNFKNRVRVGGPGLAMGILGLLGAEQMADAMGITDPAERFPFIVYSMHGGMHTGKAAGEIMANRVAGRPYDFVNMRTVGTGSEAAIELTYEARTTMSRALWASLTRNFIGETAMATAMKTGSGVLRLPVQAAYHMGPGLATSRMVDATFGELLEPGSTGRHALGFGAFFIPDAYRLAFGARGMALARKLGLGLVGRAFAAGFVLDLMMLGTQRVALGSGAEYRRSVEARIGDSYFDDRTYEMFDSIDKMHWSYSWAAYAGGFLTTGLSETLNFVAPVSSNWARTMDAEGDHGEKYEWAVLNEDLAESYNVREDLPEQIVATLVSGVGTERDLASFYTGVSFSMLGSEIEPEGRVEDLADDLDDLFEEEGFAGMGPEEQGRAIEGIMGKYSSEVRDRAMSVIGARNLQRSLAALHFIHIHANSDIREMVGDDGAILEGKGDEFLNLAFPGTLAAVAKGEILEMRRASLVARVLDAEGGEGARLTKLAQDVGLASDDGRLLRNRSYYAALVPWVKSVDPDKSTERGEKFNGHVATLMADLITAKDPIRRQEIEAELYVIGESMPKSQYAAALASAAPSLDTVTSNPVEADGGGFGGVLTSTLSERAVCEEVDYCEASLASCGTFMGNAGYMPGATMLASSGMAMTAPTMVH